ncbi:MAG: hypothetical protein JWP35_2244 [Caulobacter sp.]|nr:hypothetical protein [Caulobacter sp.]
MSPPLAIVSDNTALPYGLPNEVAAETESLSGRIQRLQAETRAMAVQHIQILEAAIDEVRRLAGEVAGGGEAYPVGARELARQMLGDCEGRRRALDAIVGRAVRA